MRFVAEQPKKNPRPGRMPLYCRECAADQGEGEGHALECRPNRGSRRCGQVRLFPMPPARSIMATTVAKSACGTALPEAEAQSPTHG